MIEAWIAFHAGEFQKANDLGVKAGSAGVTVANKAQAIYANYLEARRKAKARAARRSRRARRGPAENRGEERQRVLLAGVRAGALRAGHLDRQGAGAGHRFGKVKNALETTIKLAPKHADANIALGCVPRRDHRQGRCDDRRRRRTAPRRTSALKNFEDRAQAQSRLGDRAHRVRERPRDAGGQEVTRRRPSNCMRKPPRWIRRDAMEKLDVELAKAELED